MASKKLPPAHPQKRKRKAKPVRATPTPTPDAWCYSCGTADRTVCPWPISMAECIAAGETPWPRSAAPCHDYVAGDGLYTTRPERRHGPLTWADLRRALSRALILLARWVKPS